MARWCVVALGFGLTVVPAVRSAEPGPLLATIKAVGREGRGNAAAAQAWRELVKHGPKVLPDVLAAMDDASPAAANWLRAAVEAIADRALAAKQLPAESLEAFVKDTRHAGPPRRLAFEWLVKAEPTARLRLLAGMLDDPGSELRREAVELELRKAEALFVSKDAAALPMYQKLLGHARDYDQVQLIAGRLDKLGHPMDLTAHLGFITRWAVIGPFDNRQGRGFHTVYPPERGIDLHAEYEGKDGAKLRWGEATAETPTATADLKRHGRVDFNDIVGEQKGATMYAFAAVVSHSERPVEVRVGSNNAVRFWLNGREIFFREEYHHGVQIDQHVGKGTLKAGRNEILIKVCQNEQTEDWARQWSFQLRVCDALGGAVPLTVVTPKLPPAKRS
ncbi:MAG: hypothetical protein NZO58_03855 [Gemmataceae bacterium]|nr:hypothetical protein [Gemmataceae bacterium]